MMRKLIIVALPVVLAAVGAAQAAADEPFVRLMPLGKPKIVAAAQPWGHGAMPAENLLDDSPLTEYASDGKGTETFVEFDFGAPVTIGAFRHVNRNDPALVAASELTFSDAAGKPVAKIPVPHVGGRAGVTMFALPKPVTAQRVRWQVTKIVTPGISCVGGSEIRFFQAGPAEGSPRGIGIDARTDVIVERKQGQLVQSLVVAIDYPYMRPIEAVLRVAGQEPRPLTLKLGSQRVEFPIPAIETKQTLHVAVDYAGQPVVERQATLKPARKWVVYLLPHSHIDIGYTHVQTEVERKQWDNINKALALCAKSANYPPEARFKWNAEVLWAMDSYLRRQPPEKQQRLVDAIRAGQVELGSLYGNELTGLCRPEELLRLMERAMTIGRRCGVKVDSAMISDVPGYTWGIVPAMAQAGVKYFSIGPNYCARIGQTLSAWEDKPFYWLAPDRQHKVLCWIPYFGYAFGHVHQSDVGKVLPQHLVELERKGYPYDMVELRWCVGGDNGPPDAGLSDMVKNWNAKYAWPKLVITTTSRLFREFEKRYASKIPVVHGDFTPYWEDGAGSTARETALNRTAAERLAQAEAISAMVGPKEYPAAAFSDAWRNVLLYDEHTWGASNSVNEPDKPFVKDQWKIKQAFALHGDAESKELLAAVLARRRNGKISGAVDVLNTSAWPRTDLVTLSKELSVAGDVVTGPDGQVIPSQRLSTGELAFLAKGVLGLAGRRYTVVTGKAPTTGSAKAEANIVSTRAVSVQVEPTSGAIVSLRSTAVGELCDAKSSVGLNHYYYVLADKVKKAGQAGPAKISVKESGSLVASLLVESDAPGCLKFSREIRVIDGLDRVDIVNVLDKKAVRVKEGVHLGFAFHVPNGVMRMDIPWAVMRPETDQIAGSCKNWFSVGRWVDVSNDRCGVTWATLDAPLVEVGGITAAIVGMGDEPGLWLSKLEPSQTLYSWVMNNHWFTNYKADQDGPTTFRYSVLPHQQYDQMAVQRFGIERSQPLVATAAQGAAPDGRPLLEVDSPDVLVASVKPSEDHRAIIVRLFGAAGRPAKTTLHWGRRMPRSVWISNLAEEPVARVNGAIDVPAYGLITLRAE
jgi:hypothetical protein